MHQHDKYNMKLVWHMAIAEIRTEAARGYMGSLWWVLEPILYMGVFYVVFDVLRLRGGEDIAPFLLVGLVAWKWFATSIAAGSVSIKRVSGLIQQVYVPKYVFVLVSILTNFMRFLVVLLLLLLFLVAYGFQPAFTWLGIVPVVLVQGFLVFGVTGVFAALIPFAEDLRILVNNGLTLMFFLSGIFFEISKAPEYLIGYLYLNPMVSMIDSYRAILLNGEWPEWQGLLMVSFFSMFLSLVALYLLRRFDRQYPKVLAV